jgi:serine protease Do
MRVSPIRSVTPFVLPLLLGIAGCQSANAQPPVMQPSPLAAAPTATPPPIATVTLPPAPVPATFDVAALAEQVKPLVVNITTTQAGPDFDGADPFEFFFGPRGGNGPKQPKERGPRRVALGTGFIIDPAGYVITNDHVVHDAEDVRVRLADDRELKADVVGHDAKLDLALLKLEGAKNLPAAPLGSSDQLRVGEHVLAVGNPFGLGHTVTLGIVSAKARAIGAGPYDDFIQTDASINPGNSGGPLFNWRGEVVGINAAIRRDANGIGFAIPVDDLKSILPQLREKGHVDRGKLGLAFQPVSADLATALGLEAAKGALVSDVEPGGSAARAGIKAGDVVVAVNGTPIGHAEELPRRVAINAPGSSIKVTYVRNRQPHDVSATLDELRDDTAAQGTHPGKSPTDKGHSDNRLGLEISETGGAGVKVDSVRAGSVVHDLEAGDVIVEMNGSKVTDVASLAAVIQKAKPGTTALLKVRRGRLIQYAAIPIPSK